MSLCPFPVTVLIKKEKKEGRKKEKSDIVKQIILEIHMVIYIHFEFL